MSNGYGYKGAVSPASTGGYGHMGGYGYATPYPGMAAASAPGFGPSMMSPSMMSPSMMSPYMMSPFMPQTAVAGVQSQQGGVPVGVPSGSFVTPSGGNVVAMPVVEESYVENILRLNRGKMATFYMTYENNKEWNAKVFRGIVEAAGRDHIIISDPATGMRFLLLTLNLDYVTFDGPINYEYPFQGGTISNSTPVATTLPATTAAAPSGTMAANNAMNNAMTMPVSSGR